MDSKPSAIQPLGSPSAAAIAGLRSPSASNPLLTSVMIAAATAAAAKAAHEVGLGPPARVDPLTTAAFPAAAAVQGPLSSSTSAPLGVATVPVGSPDGKSAPKTIGPVGMNTSSVGILSSLALRTGCSGLLAAQAVEEGELQLGAAARSLAMAAAASLTAPTAAATAAAVQALQQQHVTPVNQAVVSPFAVQDTSVACDDVASPGRMATVGVTAGVNTNTKPGMLAQVSAYESGEIPRQQSALEVGEVGSTTDQRKAAGVDTPGHQRGYGAAVQPKQHEKPHSGAAGPSRLAPHSSISTRPTAGVRRPAGGGKVCSFKIAATSKQLSQVVSATAAATFGRGVSPDAGNPGPSPASEHKGSRAPSPAPQQELAAAVAAAAAAAGAAAAALHQPNEERSQQPQGQQQHNQHRRKSSSSLSRNKNRRCSSTGRRGSSRSRSGGRSRNRSSSSDGRSRSSSRSSSRSRSRDRRYYSSRRRHSSSRSSSRGYLSRYYGSRPGRRGAHNRSRSRERSCSLSDRNRYSRRFDAAASGRHDHSRQARDCSRSRDRHWQRHRSSSRSRSSSRPRDRYRQRQRPHYSRYSNKIKSSSRSRSPVRSHSRDSSRGVSPGGGASYPALARGGTDARPRPDKDSQEPPRGTQGKAAFVCGSADAAEAGAYETASGKAATAKTISSSIEKQRQRELERNRNTTDKSRNREVEEPREGKSRQQQQQQHSSGAARIKAGVGVGVRVGPFHNPTYCPNPPPSDHSIKFWRGRDGYVHDRQGNKWDANTKLLVEAGPGSNTMHGTDTAARTAAAIGPPRSSAATSGAGATSLTDNSSKRQRRDAGAAQQQQQPGQQTLGAGRPALAPAARSAAGTGAGPRVQAAVQSSSALLPEELDVDMEIEEPLQRNLQETAADSTRPAARALPAAGGGALHKSGTAAAGNKGQLLRTRQFGSAARKPPALTITAASRAAAPAADRTVAAAPLGAAAMGVVGGGVRVPRLSVPPVSPPPASSPVTGSRGSAQEGGHSNTEYQAVAREALQHNLSTLDTTSFKSSATLELEASTLKSAAAKVAGSHGWDVRALLLHMSSCVKYLEWAHSYAGSGGVGVGLASISKQQAYKNNLTEAATIVRSCAKLAKQQIVARAAQVKAAGRSYQPMTAVDYAYAAVRLLADKLDAVASMNLLFVKTQGYNSTMRNLTQNTSPATVTALDGPASNAMVQAGAPGSMAAPAARAPAAGGGGNGRGRGGGAAGGGFGPSPGESGTQNSASSAIEFVAAAAEGSSRANDRADLAEAVQEYITVTDLWASVSEANEAYLQKTGRAAAAAAAAEAAADGKAGRPSSSGCGSEPISAAALAAAHRVGQLILAVGFEAGLWDLPSVLDIARQASDAIMNFTEAHGSSAANIATPQQQQPGGGASGGGGGGTRGEGAPDPPGGGHRGGWAPSTADAGGGYTPGSGLGATGLGANVARLYVGDTAHTPIWSAVEATA